MTNLELVLNMLAEASTTEISKKKKTHQKYSSYIKRFVPTVVNYQKLNCKKFAAASINSKQINEENLLIIKLDFSPIIVYYSP